MTQALSRLTLLSLGIAVVALRAPMLSPRIARKTVQVGSIVGVGGGLITCNPDFAQAAVSSGASEALQLLNGYETHTPYTVTWVALLAGGSYLLFEFYKFMASL